MLNVEDGTGVPFANSYASIIYAYQYLSDRNKVVDWAATVRIAQEAALIAATDYIDKRFGLKFLGRPLIEDLAIPGRNMILITSLPSADQTLTIGSTVYTFKVSASLSNEITIGAAPTNTATNIAAVLATNTQVTAYSSGTLVVLTSIEAGVTDDILTSSTSPSLLFENSKMTGGSVDNPQPLCFPRTAFIGIPEVLKMATVEYAVRSLEGPLMPDPVVEDTGQRVRRRSEKVGPVEEELVYQDYAGAIFKTYPEVDYLIKPLIPNQGGVYR